MHLSCFGAHLRIALHSQQKDVKYDQEQFHRSDISICFLVVETGHWFSGKEIVISLKQIDSIGYWESKVFVNASREAILQAPEYNVPLLGTAYHTRESSTSPIP